MDNNKERVPCVGIFYKVEVPDNFYPNIIISIIGNIPDIIIYTIKGLKYYILPVWIHVQLVYN